MVSLQLYHLLMWSTRKKPVKSVVSQTDLTWVSSDTPMQTVICITSTSGGPGSVSAGTQASSRKLVPASSYIRALRESALQVDKRSGSPGAGPSSFSRHRTLTLGAGSKSSSEPRAPTDGARSGTAAPRHRALAGKVKVAGAWVNAVEFSKPAASRRDKIVLVSNEFHEILPKLPDKLLSFCNTRKENTVLNRLHYWSLLFDTFLYIEKRRGSCLCCM